MPQPCVDIKDVRVMIKKAREPLLKYFFQIIEGKHIKISKQMIFLSIDVYN